MKLEGDVILIADDEKAINYKWRENADKLSGKLQIVSYDDIKESIANNSIVCKSKIGTGSMLVLNPLDKKTYIEINEYQDAMLKYKFRGIERVASALGATQIKFSVVLTQEKKRNVDINVEAGSEYVDVDADIKKQHQEKLSNEYSYLENLENVGEVNVDLANQIAREMGLAGESDICDMIERRSPNWPSKTTDKLVKIKASEEVNDDLEVAATISVLKGVFDIKGSVKEAISQKREITIESYIKF